jgi:hypothetical protein
MKAALDLFYDFGRNLWKVLSRNPSIFKIVSHS